MVGSTNIVNVETEHLFQTMEKQLRNHHHNEFGPIPQRFDDPFVRVGYKIDPNNRTVNEMTYTIQLKPESKLLENESKVGHNFYSFSTVPLEHPIHVAYRDFLEHYNVQTQSVSYEGDRAARLLISKKEELSREDPDDAFIKLYLSEWQRKAGEADLIYIAIGSGDNGGDGGKSQREPRFVTDARKGGLHVEVLNIGPGFRSLIGENGQSFLHGFVGFGADRNLLFEQLRQVVVNHVFSKKVIVADFIDGICAMDRLSELIQDVSLHQKNLSLIVGYGDKMPVAIPRTNEFSPSDIYQNGMSWSETVSEEVFGTIKDRVGAKGLAYKNLNDIELREFGFE